MSCQVFFKVKAHFSWIDCIIHDLLPPFEGGNLKQGNVGMAHVVKGNLRIDPFCVIFW